MWQTYVVGFNTAEEKQSIFDILKKHNSTADWELFGINIIKVKKQYRRGTLADFKYFMIFGNGGNYRQTLKFLYKNWIRAIILKKQHLDRCDVKTATTVVL